MVITPFSFFISWGSFILLPSSFTTQASLKLDQWIACFWCFCHVLEVKACVFIDPLGKSFHLWTRGFLSPLCLLDTCYDDDHCFVGFSFWFRVFLLLLLLLVKELIVFLFIVTFSGIVLFCVWSKVFSFSFFFCLSLLFLFFFVLVYLMVFALFPGVCLVADKGVFQRGRIWRITQAYF